MQTWCISANISGAKLRNSPAANSSRFVLGKGIESFLLHPIHMFGSKKKHKNMEENQNIEQEKFDTTSEAEISTDNISDEHASESDVSTDLEKEKQKSAELHDKYLRLYSDFDNFRKRSQKERADLIMGANKDLLLRIIPIIDDLDRAMLALEKSNDLEALKEGVSLIHNKFRNVLQASGLAVIEADGQAFDAEIHEAITTIPAPTEELKGKVVDQIKKGYYLNNKVIRHAQVVVGE